MTGNVLIPGGELSMIPTGTWTDKNGQIRPSPKKVWVTFGKISSSYRTDQLKALYESIKTNQMVRDFLEIDE